MHITLVRKTAVIVLSSGEIINKKRVTQVQEELLLSCIDAISKKPSKKQLEELEEKIIDGFASAASKKKRADVKAAKQTISFIDQVKNKKHKDFYVQEDKEHGLLLYMNEIPEASIPQVLAEQIAEAQGDPDRYQALKAFWMMLANNPDPLVRERAFDYITKNGIHIGKSGMIITFRRADKKEVKGESAVVKLKNITLEQVSELYLQVKRWKKSPKNYQVIKDKDGNAVLHDLKKEEPKKIGPKVLGVLQDVFDKLQAMQEKTKDATTELRYYANNRTKTKFYVDGEAKEEPVYYALFKETRLNRDQCDPNPARECSYGLHLGTPSYVNGNSWLGNTIIVCLSSPMDIVAVPNSDTYKARFAAVYPIATITQDTFKSYLNSSKHENIDDTEYAAKVIENFKARIEKNKVAELKKGLILPDSMTKAQFISNLDSYKELISKRVVKAPTIKGKTTKTTKSTKKKTKNQKTKKK